MVHIPGHPRANTNPYVFEHILVMEEMVGRYLMPLETVHHRNGVQDDNRPENLELWVRPQPTGVRATDAIAWATEVLERFSYRVFHPSASRYRCATGLIVEVKGFEPLSPGDRLGLLRAEPMHRSHPSVSIGRGPRGQSGCVVPRRPPNRTGGVSLLR